MTNRPPRPIERHRNDGTPGPWLYLPQSDTDGETVGTDHFVMGDGGAVQLAVAPTEADGRKLAAALKLIEACEYTLDVLRQRIPLPGGESEVLATRLAGMGGATAERLLTEALTLAKGEPPCPAAPAAGPPRATGRPPNFSSTCPSRWPA